MASRLPIIGVSSLELEAYPFRRAGQTVCALLEAGRGEAASALISNSPDLNRLREDRISGPDDLLDEIERLGLESVLFLRRGTVPMGGDDKRANGSTGCHLPGPRVRQG